GSGTRQGNDAVTSRIVYARQSAIRAAPVRRDVRAYTGYEIPDTDPVLGNESVERTVKVEESGMSDVLIERPELDELGVYEFGWADSDVAGASAKRGISPEVVADISQLKDEPEWMLKNRLKALSLFFKK